ncbi:hypothetical protein HKT18_11615 [Flavobacterium sp. IMCC34852]|uniref:Uncharacterized protein n=1 Tax=Flavobacterium rivulicola TaxID=2732161 RepID=A0A7Y3RB45_9FLAO|nr:hypothetical protein [Flavobacterium sp. IMCC34852]NNT72865.1 hypothetical protein [Flavobacterium sp. IMCC34852]
MKKVLKIVLPIMAIVCLAVYLIIRNIMFDNGYESTQKDKYPEVPFFPHITSAEKFVNKPIDSMYVRNFYSSKKFNQVVVEYVKDSATFDSVSIALFTSSLKKIYSVKLERDVYWDYDEKQQKLFIAQEVYYTDKDDNLSNKIDNAFIIDITTGKKEVLNEIDSVGFKKIKNELTVLKHFTGSYQTGLIYFKNNKNDYCIAKNEHAAAIAKEIKIGTNNFDFTVSMLLAGDPKIKNEKIKLSERIVTNNELGFHLSFDINNHYSAEAEEEHKRNEGYKYYQGWFDKDELYYFTMKLKNETVRFKSILYYYSDFYFIELNKPTTDNDTLNYYTQNRLFQFYKKNN